MPIVRTYGCEDCNHLIEVTLTAEQWNEPPPACPACAARSMRQEFKPVAITGSPSARAHTLAEEIITTDYHAADFQREPRSEGTPKVRYKDEKVNMPSSSWTGLPQATLQDAMAKGRHTRINYGSGLDVLQANIKSGAEPDLIANSKRRGMRVW